VTFLRLLVLAAVTLSGVFGEAGARTVSLETDTFVVDLYVDVAESTGSVVAHLSTGVDDTRVIALQHRGGGRWGHVRRPRPYTGAPRIRGAGHVFYLASPRALVKPP